MGNKKKISEEQKKLNKYYSSAKYKNVLEVYAKDLRDNLPKSEVWFHAIWKKLYTNSGDEYNVVYKGFIPDLINHKYRYVIEIDGSIHSNEKQQKRDRVKDSCYKNNKYLIFRIKDGDEAQIHFVAKLIRSRVEEFDKVLNKKIEKLTVARTTLKKQRSFSNGKFAGNKFYK